MPGCCSPGYKVYINSRSAQKNKNQPISPRHNDRRTVVSPVPFTKKNQQIDRLKVKNMNKNHQSKMLKTLLDNNDLGIAVAVYANKNDSSKLKYNEESTTKSYLNMV